VLYQIIVEYEDVIQIHHHKTIVEMPKDIIHHPHERFWGICQAKGHDHPFKNTLFGLEGTLPYMFSIGTWW
jgi:hypothetical protein